MSISDWQEKERTQRRESIIDSAEALFFKEEYNEVTMDDIAKKVGLAKGTLYLYYHNKESLFFAVALRGMRLLNQMHLICSNLETAGIGKLRALTRGYCAFAKEHPEYFVMLCQAASNPSLAKGNEDGREFMDLAQDNIRIASGILEQGRAEGAIRQDIGPEELTVLLSLVGNSVLGMAPVWRSLLKGIGIEEGDIWNRYLRFISPAIVASPGIDLFGLGQDDRDEGRTVAMGS